MTLGQSTAQTNVADGVAAVDTGVLWAIKQTQLIGGDIFAKRAILASTATNTTGLLADIQIAADYLNYCTNWQAINSAIAGSSRRAVPSGLSRRRAPLTARRPFADRRSRDLVLVDRSSARPIERPPNVRKLINRPPRHSAMHG